MKRHAPARRLALAIKERGSYRVVAQGLPAHFTYIHKIAQGKREPDLGLAIALEQRLGIPVEDWPSLRQPVRELLRLRGMAA